MSVRRKRRKVSVFSVILLILLLIIALGLALLRPKGDPARALNAQIEGQIPVENALLSEKDKVLPRLKECF